MIGAKPEEDGKFYVRVNEMIHELSKEEILIDPD
jgi:hypothetical protein